MGELDLNVEYLYSLTYRQFMNILRGKRKKENTMAKERLLLTRKLMYASLLPHLKQGTTEESVWSFEWEKEALNVMNEKTQKELQEELNEMKAFWARVDSARKKPDC